ncbi:E3 ubiquitin-protein ligase UPL4 isoform X1 [Vigna radiata var. radiata]|uniref:HECT-type E3 ubiquitin transferase n=1 Tax=Vigna radiata var. radiata TaxID=3916 RepID=A0A1S3TDQ5_VIGRR|nr:E3 ubiquitin-protein ligase UPL4 isoform X1 [Vigna radiata var. radiata]
MESGDEEWELDEMERYENHFDEKFEKAAQNLSKETEPYSQLALLIEICGVLPFCSEDTVSHSLDLLSPLLVEHAKKKSNPDIMLFSLRAITFVCDLHPPAPEFFVEHDFVPTLCESLFAIQYVDVAEQCVKVLEKISLKRPLVCLKAGAVMAVLNHIDFFSTDVKRVALSTTVNLCKKLSSESPLPFLEAAPILCNLLGYEDHKLVENVATCLIKIVDSVYQSSELLDELCKHGLIQQVTLLLSSSAQTTLSELTYYGLVGLLVKLSSRSFVAFRKLYELNISSILTHILSTFELTNGVSMSQQIGGNCNWVNEVLKLLNELVPDRTKDQNDQLVVDKESFLDNHSDLLQRLGMDVFPMLIKMLNCGASLYVWHGCLSVMYKIVRLSKSGVHDEFLKNVNISSFLAGVFTQKDQHTLMLALLIAEIILQKFPDDFFILFLKEGVYFAIDSLVRQEKRTTKLYPVYCGTQLDFSKKSATRQALKCPCYAFSSGHSSTSSEVRKCKLDKSSVFDLAEHIKTTYFVRELFHSQTDALQNLRTLCNDLLSMSTDDGVLSVHEEKTKSILYQIMDKLTGKEQFSIFEFIGSGVLKSLADYLSQGRYMRKNMGIHDVFKDNAVIKKRFETLATVCLFAFQPLSCEKTLSVFIRNLQSALTSLETFPVILSSGLKLRGSYVTVPKRRHLPYPSLNVCFVKAEGEDSLNEYLNCTDRFIYTVDPFSSLHSIEGFLRPKLSSKRIQHAGSSSIHALWQPKTSPPQSPLSLSTVPVEIPVNLWHTDMMMDLPETQGYAEELQMNVGPNPEQKKCEPASCSSKATQKVVFYYEGQRMDHKSSLYQEILRHALRQNDPFSSLKLWTKTHKITYRTAVENEDIIPPQCHSSPQDSSDDNVLAYYEHTSFFSDLLSGELVTDLEKPSPTYDILFLLKSLEKMNRIIFHLMSRERIYAFAKGKVGDLDSLKITVPCIPQNEFVSTKLTEKLEQQMRDPLAVSIGAMPSWCNQLMASCPFLFGFEARCKYFKLEALSQAQTQPGWFYNGSGSTSDLRVSLGELPRKKFLVHRNRILESSAKMMKRLGNNKSVLLVAYNGEVGSGLGPTLEFYTLVCHEFQKPGLGMWREEVNLQVEETRIRSFHGLFPRPWLRDTSGGIHFSEVEKKFFLLGQVLGKALHDGRILDFHFSKAFYKLILGKELSLYDIQWFDPELYVVLQEFQALVMRKKYMESINEGNSDIVSFRDQRIEDLCLDFTLPGYPDIVLASGTGHSMVNMRNLEDYVSLIVDATVRSGISRQVKAFQSGFNKVLPIERIQIFNEEELERVFCGESDPWAINDLEHQIIFHHGYTARSPPIVNFLEILQEFDHEQKRAFMQFVTGSPRLPLGGLASLSPMLTIVRKHSSDHADRDLPSVMTCVNYLKLPPYSSKEIMKEKLLYVITEGQGSFHLS